jgi:lipopolysaccharide transport system permease protein
MSEREHARPDLGQQATHRLRLRDLALAWPLAKRDVLARYRGSLGGLAWALLGPLAMVAVYTLVFRGVFNARWGMGDAAESGFSYVTRLFAGLLVFQAVTEVANRASRLMQDNGNLVKRVVFPLELLTVALLLQVGVHTALQAGVLTVLLLLFGDGARWTWMLLPAAAAWLLLLQYALALALSALGTYLRDVQHVVSMAMTGLMFLSPVLYPADAAPPVLKTLLLLNPLTAPIELARAAWFGSAVDWAMLAAQGAALLAATMLAHWLFHRLRPGFADLV